MGLEGQGRVGSGGRGRRRCRHGEGFSRRRQRLDVARPARLYADGEETLDLTQAAVPPRAFDLLLNPSLKKLISQRFAKDRSVDAEIARCLGDELEARMKAFSSASIDVCVWSKKKKKQSSGPLETSGLRVFAARLDLLLQLSNRWSPTSLLTLV